MIDKAKFKIPPTRLPSSLLADPDSFFTGDLLSGGQLLPCKKFRVEEHGRKFWLLAGPGDAIKIAVKLNESNQPIATGIEVNLPKLIYGHNGTVPDEAELLLALSRLEDHLEDIFESRDVARALIPGVAGEHSDSSWEMIEIAAHRLDPDNKLFRALKNAKHPCSPKRYISDDESVRFGTKRSKTAISVYKKKREMQAKHGEDKVDGDDDVLRIEVILKSGHLLEAFRGLGSPTVKIRNIDDVPRLMSFAWADLVRVHQRFIAKFQGAFTDAPAAKDKTDGIGLFIAQAYHQFGDPDASDVHQWIELFGSVSGAAKDRLRRVRGACMQRLERLRLGTQTFADWFGDAAYLNPPVVSVPAKERVTVQIRQFQVLSDAVVRAYAPRGFSRSFPWSRSA